VVGSNISYRGLLGTHCNPHADDRRTLPKRPSPLNYLFFFFSQVGAGWIGRCHFGCCSSTGGWGVIWRGPIGQSRPSESQLSGPGAHLLADGRLGRPPLGLTRNVVPWQQSGPGVRATKYLDSPAFSGRGGLP